MASKKAKRSVRVVVAKPKVTDKKLSHTAMTKQMLPEALKQDIDFINNQINAMSTSVGHLTPEDQYSSRQQMLELLRFKYMLLGYYNY